MTNKNDELLEQAVAEALETPAPQEVERKPYLFETTRSRFRQGLKKNNFRLGSKKTKLVPKLDAEGNELRHGNGGWILKEE